jgi:hypothetical protein
MKPTRTLLTALLLAPQAALHAVEAAVAGQALRAGLTSTGKAR